jgi:hypothetical protein
MLNLKHIEQDIESVVAGADPDAIDMLAEHCQTLINEVERLRESSPEHVTEEILCMFETAFGETVPEGATQWGYTKHACAEIERLRGEPERVLAYVYESLTKEPWDASRGPLTANCLWIEIGKWIDQARAEERERCAALCDAEAAIWDGMSGVGEQRAVRIGRTVAAQGLARAIRALD